MPFNIGGLLACTFQKVFFQNVNLYVAYHSAHHYLVPHNLKPNYGESMFAGFRFNFLAITSTWFVTNVTFCHWTWYNDDDELLQYQRSWLHIALNKPQHRDAGLQQTKKIFQLFCLLLYKIFLQLGYLNLIHGCDFRTHICNKSLRVLKKRASQPATTTSFSTESTSMLVNIRLEVWLHLL